MVSASHATKNDKKEAGKPDNKPASFFSGDLRREIIPYGGMSR